MDNFNAYMKAVDKELESRVGMGNSDLPDYNWRDCYNDEVMPEEAVDDYLASDYSPLNF